MCKGKKGPNAGLLSNVVCCHYVSSVRHLSTAIRALFCRTALAVSLPVIFCDKDYPALGYEFTNLSMDVLLVMPAGAMYEGTRVVVLVYEGTGVEAMYEGTRVVVLVYEGTGVEAMYEGTGVEAMYEGTGVEAMYEGTGVEAMYEGTGVEAMYEGTGVEAMYEGSG